MRPFDDSRCNVSKDPRKRHKLLDVSGEIGQRIHWLATGKGNRPDRVLRLIAVVVGANRDHESVTGLDDDRLRGSSAEPRDMRWQTTFHGDAPEVQ